MTRSMQIALEIIGPSDSASEVVLDIDFAINSHGCPAHMGSMNYPGHPAEPMEIEIETIFWPIKKWAPEKGEFVDDHIEFPYEALPGALAEAIETHIIENYVPDYGDGE